MTEVAVDDNDRPRKPVVIQRCGELERRNKKTRSIRSAETSQLSETSDRGRIRKEEGAANQSRKHSQVVDRDRQLVGSRKRRPSDNVRDEGLRGRPRKRSKARTDDSAIDEQSHSDLSDSPVKIHKRNRSPSPSPAYTTEEDDEDHRRRRRSLPNQYLNHQRYHSRTDRQNTRQWRDSHRRDDRYKRDISDRDRFGDYRRAEYKRDDGRLMHSGSQDEQTSGVKFKGRGVMKYREPGRL